MRGKRDAQPKVQHGWFDCARERGRPRRAAGRANQSTRSNVNSFVFPAITSAVNFEVSGLKYFNGMTGSPESMIMSLKASPAPFGNFLGGPRRLIATLHFPTGTPSSGS